MDLYVIAPFVFIAAVIGACLWADWLRRGRKRRYEQDMAQWHRDMAQWEQNEHLRKIAEQHSRRQDSST